MGLYEERVGIRYDDSDDQWRKVIEDIKSGNLTQNEKHGAREGSAFPEPKGNVEAVNNHASDIVSDILSNPASSTTARTTSRFGDVIDVRDPGGRGIRFSKDGKFIGFLEPNP
jgi:hypothetical protein